MHCGCVVLLGLLGPRVGGENLDITWNRLEIVEDGLPGFLYNYREKRRGGKAFIRLNEEFRILGRRRRSILLELVEIAFLFFPKRRYFESSSWGGDGVPVFFLRFFIPKREEPKIFWCRYDLICCVLRVLS